MDGLDGSYKEYHRIRESGDSRSQYDTIDSIPILLTYFIMSSSVGFD